MGMTTYIHEQQVASSTWTVNHDLGCKPVVEVLVDVDGVRQKIFPLKVKHTSDTVMQITFVSPRTGVARLVGI